MYRNRVLEFSLLPVVSFKLSEISNSNRRESLLPFIKLKRAAPPMASKNDETKQLRIKFGSLKRCVVTTARRECRRRTLPMGHVRKGRRLQCSGSTLWWPMLPTAAFQKPCSVPIPLLLNATCSIAAHVHTSKSLVFDTQRHIPTLIHSHMSILHCPA